MNVISLIRQLSHFLGIRENETVQLLQQQREILHHGIEGFAEVIHLHAYERQAGKLLQVQLWLKLKKPDGCFIYTHSRTLINNNHIPERGTILRVRYIPQNLSSVIIVGEENSGKLIL